MQIYIEILVLETHWHLLAKQESHFICSPRPEVGNTKLDIISHSTRVSRMPALNLGFLFLMSLGPRMASSDI